jgi:BlaI family transcriptional regulator, penicillinase repressor
MPELSFGRVQMRIMQILWAKKRATAREITDAMNEYEPTAHSTVQTLIRTLEQKGAITHDVDDRTFVFYPLVKDEKVLLGALREFIDLMFNGSAEGLVAYLVKNDNLSQDELKKVSDLFIERMFAGSAGDLVTYLVKNGYLKPEELKRISEGVSTKEK